MTHGKEKSDVSAIGEVAQGGDFRIKVDLVRRPDGHQRVGLRVFQRRETLDGEQKWFPTQIGMSIRDSELDGVLALLQQAQERLQRDAVTPEAALAARLLARSQAGCTPIA